VYQGCPDESSALGIAAASWHTFDRRVWEKNGLSVTLVSLGCGPSLLGSRRAVHYEVTVKSGSRTRIKARGHDWQRLVREAKTWAERVLGGPCAG